MILDWTDELIAGFEEIDTQHRELFEKANDFFHAARENKEKDVLVSTLNFLVEYVKYHFGTETELMKKCGYPRMAEHVADHKVLVEKLVVLYKQLIADGMENNLEKHVSLLLRQWYVAHIMDYDKRLATYLKAWKRTTPQTTTPNA